MLLITGGSGRLGRELRAAFPEAQAPPRSELDLWRPESVAACLDRYRPDAVVHAAAYTDVRRAEEDKERCWRTNVGGTEVLVDGLAARNPQCYFVYLSTACVFQGDRGMNTEEDVPHPKNFYGLTKLIGEYVAKRLSRHLIVRTNFAARERWSHPRAFVDRFGTYLWAEDVAYGIREVMEAGLTGTVHISGDRTLSMLDLARLTTPEVEPLSIREVVWPLTVDMTLKSLRIRAYPLGVATSAGIVRGTVP